MPKQLSRSRLLEVIEYDETSGMFTWKRRVGVRPGVAGSIQTGGYRQIVVDGKTYVAHRLAWFYTYGMWPPDQLDHINGIRDDNRIANLRLATQSLNQLNAKRKIGVSGIRGVYQLPSGNWRAAIPDRKRRFTKTYPTAAEAAAARQRVIKKMFGVDGRVSDRPTYPNTRAKSIRLVSDNDLGREVGKGSQNSQIATSGDPTRKLETAE